MWHSNYRDTDIDILPHGIYLKWPLYRHVENRIGLVSIHAF